MPNQNFKFTSAGNLRKMLGNPGHSYGVDDDNVYPYAGLATEDYNGMPYDNNTTFNASPSAGVIIDQQSATAVDASGAAVDPGYVNQNVTVQNVFTAISGANSIQVLQRNYKRTMIIIQNQSTTGNLWYSFGKPAQVNQCGYLISSQTIGLDYTCPPDAVYVYFDGTAGLVNPFIITEITTLS
jgi:hypothetical protein